MPIGVARFDPSIVRLQENYMFGLIDCARFNMTLVDVLTGVSTLPSTSGEPTTVLASDLCRTAGGFAAHSKSDFSSSYRTHGNIPSPADFEAVNRSSRVFASLTGMLSRMISVSVVRVDDCEPTCCCVTWMVLVAQPAD